MQAQILQSPWQKARHLKPALSSEVEIFRRSFRGEQWYVLRRSGSERLYRLNPAAWRIVGLCDGTRTLEAIHEQLKTGGAPVSEPDLLAGVLQLAQQGLVNLGAGQPALPALPGSRREGWWQKLRNPLAIRIPLWDPDSFLHRHSRHVRWLFSHAVLALWALVVAVAVIAAAAHWQEISHDVIDRVLSPENLLLLWCIYPVTKFFHEMAHAFAVKLQGGHVHEIGVMFMYGVPLPYVDASDALTFRHRRQRLLVDGIGIMVELFFAALALFVWLNVSAGTLSQFAYNTMIICSISTVFFNGNPLMRFDGYYLLADWLDIPNLATRSLRYWRHLFDRHALGLDNEFATGARERKWLVGYAPLALAYRVTVIFAIILVAAQYFLPLGVVLGVWLVSARLLLPLLRGCLRLVSPELGAARARGVRIAVATPVALFALLVLVPLPVQRTLPAVTWLPDKAEVRAATDGLVTAVLPQPGQHVSPGQPLFTLSDPDLAMRRDIARARYTETLARLDAAQASDRVEAEQLKEDVKSARAQLQDLEQQLQSLDVRSDLAGDFYLPPGEDTAGRFVHKGDLLGYVLDRRRVTLRVLVGQNDMGLIRGGVDALEIKLANWPQRVFDGELSRLIPAASQQLPSPVLGTRYGGEIAVEPGDETGTKALAEWFQLEVGVDSPAAAAGASQRPALWAGSRAWVRLDLGHAPLASQLYMAIRQLLMKKLQL